MTEVFTVATEAKFGFIQLQQSLTKFAVPLTVLGMGVEYRGLTWKFKSFVNAVKETKSDIVVLCDGFDTMCISPLDTLTKKFVSMGSSILFSYEPNSQRPEPEFTVNSGLIIGYRDAILSNFTDSTLDHVFFRDDLDDEAEIRQLLYHGIIKADIDTESQCFLTQLPGRKAVFDVADSAIIFPETGAEPCFVHAPHAGDLSNVASYLGL